MNFTKVGILSISLKFLNFKAFSDSIFPLSVNNYIKQSNHMSSDKAYIISGFWVIDPLSNVSNAIEMTLVTSQVYTKKKINLSSH